MRLRVLRGWHGRMDGWSVRLRRIVGMDGGKDEWRGDEWRDEDEEESEGVKRYGLQSSGKYLFRFVSYNTIFFPLKLH